MLRTPLCDLLGIEVPIICAPFGPWDEVSLAAAVCNAGGLGSVGTALRRVDELRDQWARLRDLTDRPFAINHTMRPLDPDVFEASLEAGPAAISFHVGDPGDLVRRAHDVGSLWIQQITSVEDAHWAVEREVDAIIAQGGEAGGQGGVVSTMIMVPAVVDIVGDVPVVAAGGIADGRGFAAALALGAQGINVGTRFLASTEMDVPADYKNAIAAARAQDAVKIEFADAVLPPLSPGGIRAVPRALRNAFVDRWNPDTAGAAASSEQLQAQLRAAAATGRAHEYLPLAGQSVELIHDIAPAAEIIRRLVEEAQSALATASQWVTR